MKNAIEKYKGGKKLFVTRSFPNDTLNIDNIIGTVTDIEFDDDMVRGNIDLLDLPECKEIGHFIENGMIAVRPNGTGFIEDDYTISDYKITSFSLIKK